MDAVERTEIGASSRLRAGQLRDLTGLSDRQLHEWDKRGALPHDRPKGGQRRLSVWDGMAVKIVAAIRDRYQLPLTRLRSLLQWMIGNNPSDFDQILSLLAVSMPIPKTQAQADFFGHLAHLSQQPPPRIGILKEVPELLSRADTLGHPSARSSVHQLAAGLVPLYRALGEMTIGFPVFLVTDLQSHSFVNEPMLIDQVRAGVVPESFLVIRVDEHVNAVLTTAGCSAVSIPHRASELEEIPGEILEEKERYVLELLRQRNFDRIVIEPKGRAYRIEIDRDARDAEAAKVEDLMQSHAYGSVLVKWRDGKIARLTRTESILTPDSADGKTPHRAGRHRSSED